MKKTLNILLGLVLACGAFLGAMGISRHLARTAEPGESTSAVADSDAVSAVADGQPTAAEAQPATTSGDPAHDQLVAQVKADEEANGGGFTYEMGEVLVRFKEGQNADEVNAQLQGVDLLATKTVSQDELDGEFPSATLKIADTATVAQAQAALDALDIVEHAQPNHLYYLAVEDADDMSDDEAVQSADTTYTSTSESDPDVQVTSTTAIDSYTDLQADDDSTPSVLDRATEAQSTIESQSVNINDTYSSLLWQLSDTRCNNAWSWTKCQRAVGVAVIDTGCTTDNADLHNNVVGAYNAVTGASGNSTVYDSYGHGTHTCGIIAAQTDNGIGVSGVSYNAKVMPIKVCDANGNISDDALIKAYKHLLARASYDINHDGSIGTYAQEYNIRVINMSLGSPTAPDTSEEIYGLIDKAYNAGILTVCSAGNQLRYYSGGYIHYINPPFPNSPGDYSTCTCVIALGNSPTGGNIPSKWHNDARAYYSNYNTAGSTAKNISAPGSYVLSTYSASSNRCGYATYDDNGNYYGYMSGTSMASPVVAGIAALTFAHNQSYSASQVKNIMYDTADDLGSSGWDRTYGYGKVDALRSARAWPRVAGNTALDTMAAISQKSTSTSAGGTVIVATEGGYWDALTASGLAGMTGAPVLMTDGGSLSGQTKSELQRIRPSRVIIVGGAAAVSSGVESSIRNVLPNSTIKRYSGGNAVGTANAIYGNAKSDRLGSWSSNTAIIATSDTFQDALSIAPYAYKNKCPIFLTDGGTDVLCTDTLNAIKAGGFDRVVIVGGTAAVRGSVETQLSRQIPSVDIKRLAGANCYDTSEQIAEWELTQGMSVRTMGVATGDSYYDALCAAAYCGKNNSVLVLASNTNRTTIDTLIAPRKTTCSGYVFGGSGAVSNGTYGHLADVLS